jgi:hypothetical protein
MYSEEKDSSFTINLGCAPTVLLKNFLIYDLPNNLTANKFFGEVFEATYVFLSFAKHLLLFHS